MNPPPAQSAMASGPEELIAQAMQFHAQGRLSEAQRIYAEILRASPDNFDALHRLGVIRASEQNFEEAARLITAALRESPGSVEALYHLGMVFQELKRPDEAMACYQKALAIKPDFAEACNNLGNVLSSQKRFEEAIECYQQALAARTDYADACNNLGNAYREQDRPREAIASYRRALAANPRDPITLRNLGNTLVGQKQLDEAIACYQEAVAINPDYAEVHNNLGNALAEQKKRDAAIRSYRRALAIYPEYADALYNLGNALLDANEQEEALACYRQALAAEPDHGHAFGLLLRTTMQACDWSETGQLTTRLQACFADPRFFIEPFALIGASDSPQIQFQCARNYSAHAFPGRFQPFSRATGHGRGKLRIAYLSADFHAHATAYLMAELFELHDRGRFDVIGMSFGPDDRSAMRKRLISAFDEFIDVRFSSDEEAAGILSKLEIDIAVDLKGYTKDARPGILARRPAPIQVNYLGYPGTMGADFVDYIIGDRFVTPFDHQPFYTEKIVQLPFCYQVNDSKRAISPDTPTRVACGLPETGFVFCCFNTNAKITPGIFDIWMRLLKAIDNSVLWLLGDSEIGVRNLRKEASVRGVVPDRLVFAPRMNLDGHLARHRLADLFLDTLPYNAHTTASDALWSGLPVVTCMGDAFAGRVAGSLLHAAEVPELVTHSLQDYEALALRLATDSQLLTEIRVKLRDKLMNCPLFDTNRFRKEIETAFTTMHSIRQRGEIPRKFAVAP